MLGGLPRFLAPVEKSLGGTDGQAPDEIIALSIRAIFQHLPGACIAGLRSLAHLSEPLPELKKAIRLLVLWN